MISDALPCNQKQFLAANLSQGILHLCISESVNQRVEHGSDDGIEESKHLVFWKRCGRSNVNEENRHEAQNHNCDVGATGGKSFVPAFCGVSLDGV